MPILGPLHGAEVFYQLLGLGWGGHRRTYLSLTSVGSTCNRPDRLAWMPMEKKKPNKWPIRIMILAL